MFQFNALSQRVTTSIVLPECRPEFRARIIEKWIEIAKELKTLKNYSALKAVLSSLQSEPVFRIKSAWSCVSKGSNLLFRDLTSMFENDDASSDEQRSKDLIESVSFLQTIPYNNLDFRTIVVEAKDQNAFKSADEQNPTLI